MINPDDLDPPKKGLKPLDLQPMSIAELQLYIQALETEIGRAENEIVKKNVHKNGIEALFGPPKD